MMSPDEARKVPTDVFDAYRKKFGTVDTIGMPDDMTAEYFTALMKKALEEGKPIDYEKEGWDSGSSDTVL